MKTIACKTINAMDKDAANAAANDAAATMDAAAANIAQGVRDVRDAKTIKDVDASAKLLRADVTALINAKKDALRLADKLAKLAKAEAAANNPKAIKRAKAKATRELASVIGTLDDATKGKIQALIAAAMAKAS